MVWAFRSNSYSFISYLNVSLIYIYLLTFLIILFSDELNKENKFLIPPWIIEDFGLRVNILLSIKAFSIRFYIKIYITCLLINRYVLDD